MTDRTGHMGNTFRTRQFLNVTHVSGTFSHPCFRVGHCEIGERAGTRTQDPVIKSHVLYRLSYALDLAAQILKSAGFYQCRGPLGRFFRPVLLDCGEAAGKP